MLTLVSNQTEEEVYDYKDEKGYEMIETLDNLISSMSDRTEKFISRGNIAAFIRTKSIEQIKRARRFTKAEKILALKYKELVQIVHSNYYDHGINLELVHSAPTNMVEILRNRVITHKRREAERAADRQNNNDRANRRSRNTPRW